MNIIPLQQLLAESMDNHSDPDNPDYNGCDKDPCMWCISAGEHAEIDSAGCTCSDYGKGIGPLDPRPQ